MGESIVHATDGVWKRVYRIRLMFEDPVKIKECFGVDFNVRHHIQIILLVFLGVLIV